MDPLHFQINKLQKLLSDEQDKYTRLQTDLNESETKRLDQISQHNKEIFELTTQFTKTRKELEKSEAVRHALDLELSLLKKSANEKERTIQELNMKLDDQKCIQSKEMLDVKTKLKYYETILNRCDHEKQRLLTLTKEQDKYSRLFLENLIIFCFC